MSNNKDTNKEENQLITPYRIIIKPMDSDNEVWSGKISRLRVMVLTAVVVFILGFGMFALFTWTPLHYILPGYLKHETRAQIIDNAVRLDSLTRQMELRELYMENIARILNDEISIDSIVLDEATAANLDSVKKWTPDILSKSSPESEAFSQEYEKDERFNLTMLPTPNEGILFHPPLSGNIINTFNPQQGCYGIEIQGARNASVSAVLDGTIISITHTISHGYVVMVQHNNNFVSIYRNVGECMRQVGAKVTTGERIALVGKTDNNALLFELWHAGIAVDPRIYISF